MNEELKKKKKKFLIYSEKEGYYQHSQKQRLDFGICENFLIKQDIGLRHRDLPQMVMGDSWGFFQQETKSYK